MDDIDIENIPRNEVPVYIALLELRGDILARNIMDSSELLTIYMEHGDQRLIEVEARNLRNLRDRLAGVMDSLDYLRGLRRVAARAAFS